MVFSYPGNWLPDSGCVDIWYCMVHALSVSVPCYTELAYHLDLLVIEDSCNALKQDEVQIQFFIT